MSISHKLYNNITVQTEPKYIYIAKRLKKYILKGTLKPHDKIPNEFELSKTLGVSRNTIRNAIAMLISENFLERQQGKGTFVKDYAFIKGKLLFLLYQTPEPFHSRFINDVYQGIKSEIEEFPYKLEIKEIAESVKNPESFVGDLKKEGISGVILSGKFERNFILRAGRLIPLVLTGKSLPNYKGCAVVPDHTFAFKTVLEYLLNAGYRRIAYLPTFLHHKGYKEKLETYKKLYPELLYSIAGEKSNPLFEMGEYSEACRKVIKKFSPDAIITCSDSGVLSMREAKRMGKKIPEDIAFVAMDDLGKSEIADPPMTVFDVDNEEIGRKAVQCLAAMIEGKKKCPELIRVKGRLIIRDSS